MNTYWIQSLGLYCGLLTGCSKCLCIVWLSSVTPYNCCDNTARWLMTTTCCMFPVHYSAVSIQLMLHTCILTADCAVKLTFCTASTVSDWPNSFRLSCITNTFSSTTSLQHPQYILLKWNTPSIIQGLVHCDVPVSSA